MALAVDAVILGIPFLIYFPGRQAPTAIALATGIGISRMQARVDGLEEKAINGEEFTEADKRFLKNLYTCFAKGARLTITLRQSSQMMRRYMSGTGENLSTAPRIFCKSRPVRKKQQVLKGQILKDFKRTGQTKEAYSSETFYMGDPEFLDSVTGLYFGRLTVRPLRETKNTLSLAWRAEVPWEWPSYESLFKKHGDYHAQCFPLPNAKSLLLGPRYCLWMDDGLGGHLAKIGLAKPFLVHSEWEEEIESAQLESDQNND